MTHATSSRKNAQTRFFAGTRIFDRRSLRSAAGLGLGLLSLLALSAGQAARAGAVTWNGPSGADWFSNPSYWSNSSTPGAGDDAFNNTAAAMTLGQSTTVQSFFSSGAFSLTGGTLSGSLANAAGTLQVNNVFSLNGGITNFTVNQGTGGSVAVGSGTLDSDIINANLDMATNANAALNVYNLVTENGNINLGTTGNGLQLVNTNNTTLTIGSMGSLTGFGSVYQYYGTTLTNNGLVNANSKGNMLGVNISTFNNTGTAEATNGGTLSVLGGNTTNNTGTFKADGAGSVVALNGTITNGANSLFTATNGGQIQMNGVDLEGTINGAGATALVFNGSGNQLDASGNGATVNANLDLATNANAALNVYGLVTENGNINLGTTSNGLQLVNTNNTTLTLGSAGSLTGFGSVYQYYGTTLANNGLINANSSGNTLGVNISNFNNSGTAEATNGGTLSVLGGNSTSNTGTFKADGTGSVVALTGTITNGANSLFTATNGGQIQMNGVDLEGTIHTDANTALVFSSGGNQLDASSAGATVNGNLDLATNANALLNVYGLVTENGNINLGTTSNGLQLVNTNNTTLTLGSAGSLTGFGSVYQYYGTTLANNGLINANSSGNTLGINISTFNNGGTAEATNGGILTLVGNTTNNTGALAATGGGVLNISGTLNSNAGNSINGVGGTVNILGADLEGTINGVGATTLVFNSGGNQLDASSAGATVNANLDLATNPNASLSVYGLVTENGNINLGTTGNGLQLVNTNNTTLTIGSMGSLTGFGSVYQYYGTTLTNNGLVNANSAGNTLNISTSAFNNAGTTEVQNGAALNVTSANTDSGNILVKTGGTATFTQGLTQTGGLTQVDGTLNSPLTLTGGTLAGTGTVAGNVANTGGTVSAGSSASPFGTLAVSGAFSQTSGALDAAFSSTQNNLLKVSGAVTTGGALNVNYLGTGAYTGAGPFTFLDYGSLASSLTGTGPNTQYFTNEMFLPDGTGIIDGSNGFTYALLNTTNIDNTGINGLQLEVLTNGAPVPEASTTVSFGLLLCLGGGLVAAKRRRIAVR